MELITEDRLSTGGEAVARSPDGRVVFVAGAAPNEKVRVEVTTDKKKFMRARVVEVLEPGAARVEPRCLHYDVCGGCVLQHVDPSIQTNLKAAAVQQTLARLGKVDVDQVEFLTPWSGDAYGYRTRARFAIAPGGLVGYRAERSHRIVDVTDCPILAPPVARALAALRKRPNPASKEVLEATVVTNGTTALVDLPRALGSLAGDDITTTKETDTIDADDEAGALLLRPTVFAQANRAGNLAMVRQVEAWVAAVGHVERIVELYAGSGNVTRVLAAHADTVVAIEGDEHAVALAEKTAASNVDLRATSVEEGVVTIEGASIVVLDPPRRGLSPMAAAGVVKLGASHLIYVSCDPATFSRDVERFAVAGYRLAQVRVFDLYPHTAHVEVAALLVQTNPN